MKMKNLFKIVALPSIISLASIGCDNETGFKTGGGIKKINPDTVKVRTLVSIKSLLI